MPEKGQADYGIDPSAQHFDAEQFVHLPDYRLRGNELLSFVISTGSRRRCREEMLREGGGGGGGEGGSAQR